MSLVEDAEKRRYFEPEILTDSAISAAQDGIEENAMCMKPSCCTPEKKDDLSTISHSQSPSC